MAVLKEFCCDVHGPFEAVVSIDTSTTACPKGCDESMVERVFLTAPSFQNQSTRNITAIQRDLAAQFGRTDLGDDGYTPLPTTGALKKANEISAYLSNGAQSLRPGWMSPGQGKFQVSGTARRVEEVITQNSSRPQSAVGASSGNATVDGHKIPSFESMTKIVGTYKENS